MQGFCAGSLLLPALARRVQQAAALPRACLEGGMHRRALKLLAVLGAPLQQQEASMLHARRLSSLGASTSGASAHLAQDPAQPRGARARPAAAAALRQQQQQQERSMFVQTQATPNPSSLMFLPGEKVLEDGTADFASAREGMASPLAKRLFLIDGITRVHFGTNHVTVTKTEDMAWPLLKPEIFAAIMEHYTSGEPLLLDRSVQSGADTAIDPDDSETVAMIKELLETRIRPAVQEDGGDILFKGFDEGTGVVTLKMQGACSGCPSSAVTLKSGIENMLMHYVPEVREVVEAPPDEAEAEGLREFARLERHLSV